MSNRAIWLTTLLSLGGAFALPFVLASGTQAPKAFADAGVWGVVSDQDDDDEVDEDIEETPPSRRRSRSSYDPHFAEIISRVEQMPQDSGLRSRVSQLGLNVVNVMWEDTGRSYGSSGGPNISDLTLQVREPVGNGDIRTHLLPVIRFPNYTDRTADIPIDKLFVRVGNQRRRNELETVPLAEVLANLADYVTYPGSIRGEANFLADRDTHVLASAQHVFVPLARSGKAEFNPVLYNYQSRPGNPALLVLLITRQGMSAQVIENRPGDQSYQGWGQQLYFNNAGQRTVFTAERRSAVARRIEAGEAQEQDQGALEEGADMMMVVSIPLQYRAPRPQYYGGGDVLLDGLGGGGGAGYGSSGSMSMEAAPAAPSSSAPAHRSAGASRNERSNVERAVIGHGDDLGIFREGRDLRLVRDTNFPVRVTIQFYKATSNGVVSDQDLAEAKAAIERVYADGDYVGSLVVGSLDRPTASTRIRHRAHRRHWDRRPTPYVTQ